MKSQVRIHWSTSVRLELFLLLAFFRQPSPCLFPGDFNDKPSPIRYNTKQSVLFRSSRNTRMLWSKKSERRFKKQDKRDYDEATYKKEGADVWLCSGQFNPGSFRRVHGRLFLSIQGRGFCKCADREHAPVRSERRRRRFCRSYEILLAGDHIHSGDHFSGLYPEQDTGCARALAADRFSGRNPAFVRCVLDPSVAERSGEYADFAGVWYAGRDVPIFPGQRYRNHHVHR